MIAEMVGLVLAMLTTVTIGVLAGMLAGQGVVWVINRRRTARLEKLDAWMGNRVQQEPCPPDSPEYCPESPDGWHSHHWHDGEACAHCEDPAVGWSIAVVSPPPPGPALMTVAETFDVDPQPTYYDLPVTRPYITAPYATDGVVKLGRNALCRSCIDARTNGTPELICSSCRPALVGSAPVRPEPQPCREAWEDKAGCYSGNRIHDCVLIGGHRIHRCSCGAYDDKGVPL